MRRSNHPASALAAAIIACGLSSGAASAQPHRCNVAGKVVYQQTPCQAGASSAPVNITGAGKADPEAPGAQQAQREVAEYKRQLRVTQAVRDGQVFIGMTAAEVQRSWGRPSAVNKTIRAGSTSEQWVYRRGTGRDQYVYLDNGTVTTLQASE